MKARPTKSMAKASEGDDRNSAARKRKVPGKGAKGIKAGLDQFWAKRQPSQNGGSK